MLPRAWLCSAGGEGQAAARELADRAQMYSTSDPQVQTQPASAGVAALLEIAVGQPVISRFQRLYIDDQPWSLQTSYYPEELTGQAERLIEATDIKEGTVTYLEEELGLHQVGYRDYELSWPPDEDENAAAFFGLPEDSRIPLTVRLRTAFTEVSDTLVPFRLTKSVYITGRNQFVMNVGRVPDRPGQKSSSEPPRLSPASQSSRASLFSGPVAGRATTCFSSEAALAA